MIIYDWLYPGKIKINNGAAPDLKVSNREELYV